MLDRITLRRILGRGGQDDYNTMDVLDYGSLDGFYLPSLRNLPNQVYQAYQGGFNIGELEDLLDEREGYIKLIGETEVKIAKINFKIHLIRNPVKKKRRRRAK